MRSPRGAPRTEPPYPFFWFGTSETQERFGAQFGISGRLRTISCLVYSAASSMPSFCDHGLRCFFFFYRVNVTRIHTNKKTLTTSATKRTAAGIGSPRASHPILSSDIAPARRKNPSGPCLASQGVYAPYLASFVPSFCDHGLRWILLSN